MPDYRTHGQLTNPLSNKDFLEGMENGRFVKKPEHQGFVAFLHYAACRVSEGLMITRKQFRLTPKSLFCDIYISDIKENREFLKKQYKSHPKFKNHPKRLEEWLRNYRFGQRLKHSKKTVPLPIPLDAPYVGSIVDSVIRVGRERRVWPYCRKTGYNIVRRVFAYPHYHRLSRITWFFMPHPEMGRPRGFSLAEVKSWTGLTLKALDYYVGLVGISEMGEALKE